MDVPVLNKLIARLESLISVVEGADTIKQKYGFIRYKPFFTTYNSCIKEFKTLFPEEHANLNLEDLPLYDLAGNEQSTNEKISTLLHQTHEVLAVLRSMLPKESEGLEYPQKVTLYWLVKHVPVKLWLMFASLLFIAFIVGVFTGYPEWLSNLINFIKEIKKIVG